MKVTNVIALACDFTDNEDLISLIKQNKSDERINKMLKLFNLVRNEVACEYIPILANETFVVNNFKLEFSEFKEKPIKIISVKNLKGRKLKYKIFPSYLIVNSNHIEVCYSYQPGDAKLTDIIEDVLPERVFAYALAREYFLNEGLFEDAEIFEVRFKNSLKILLNKKNEIKMPPRRWR